MSIRKSFIKTPVAHWLELIWDWQHVRQAPLGYSPWRTERYRLKHRVREIEHLKIWKNNSRAIKKKQMRFTNTNTLFIRILKTETDKTRLMMPTEVTVKHAGNHNSMNRCPKRHQPKNTSWFVSANTHQPVRLPVRLPANVTEMCFMNTFKLIGPQAEFRKTRLETIATIQTHG